MAAWVKLHWSQLSVIVCSLAVGAALHYGKLTTDQAIEAGAVLAAVGIHLPGVVYKMKPPSAATVLVVLLTSSVTICALVVLDACAPSSSGASAPNPAAAECVAHRTVKELECVDLYSTKALIDTCRAQVQAAINCVDGGASLSPVDGGSNAHD
ncbi:MAG: hypothetical protein ACHQC8_07710 [Solirubrobacterales bacterium]